MNARDQVENLQGFGVGEDGGDGFRWFGAGGVDGCVYLDLENLAVEEEEGTQGLVLCGSSNVSFDGQMSQKSFDFRCAR